MALELIRQDEHERRPGSAVLVMERRAVHLPGAAAVGILTRGRRPSFAIETSVGGLRGSIDETTANLRPQPTASGELPSSRGWRCS
jgi:hypothetical protein